MSDINIQNTLHQMRILASKANIGDQTELSKPVPGNEFVNVLKSALDTVNDQQQHAKALGEAYTLGEPNVNLIDVTLASQKAGLAFNAAVQVRNKIVNAYQEIMNMSI